MSENIPMVSVVIEGTTDKSGQIVDKTIAGLERQTYPADHIELVFMDASNDGALGRRIGHSKPNIRVIPAEELTYYQAKNVGAKEATGELVVFVDSDVVWVPEWIAEAVTSLKNMPPYSAIVGLTQYADGLFSKVGTVSQFGHHWDAFATKKHNKLMGVIANNFAMRRKEFCDVGYKYTNYRQGMDMVLASDLREMGGVIMLNPKLRAIHKWGWSKLWEHPQTAYNVGRGLPTAAKNCKYFLQPEGAFSSQAASIGININWEWLTGGSLFGTFSLVVVRYLIFMKYWWKTHSVLRNPWYMMPFDILFLTCFFSVVGVGALSARLSSKKNE
jgi:glycosyltransferase involved in cell wall biosynthesis